MGRSLASKKIKVVFGGSRYGLLGILADSVVNNGGQITGIIPEFFTSMYACNVIVTCATANITSFCHCGYVIFASVSIGMLIIIIYNITCKELFSKVQFKI